MLNLELFLTIIKSFFKIFLNTNYKKLRFLKVFLKKILNFGYKIKVIS